MNLDLEVSAVVHQFLNQMCELARRAVQSSSAETVVRWDATNKRRRRRTREELDWISWRVYAFVQRYPGLASNKINTRLNMSTRELAFPIRQLVDEELMQTEDDARATKYYIARTVALPKEMRFTSIHGN